MPVVAIPTLDISASLGSLQVATGVNLLLGGGAWSSGFDEGFGPGSGSVGPEIQVELGTLSLSQTINLPTLDIVSQLEPVGASAGTNLLLPTLEISSNLEPVLVELSSDPQGAVIISLEGHSGFSEGFSGGFGPSGSINTSIVVTGPTVGLTHSISIPTLEVTSELIPPLFIGPGIIIEVPTGEISVNLDVAYASAGVNIELPSLEIDVEFATPRLFLLRVIGTTTRNVPEEHLIDSKKLEADGYVELFEIELPSNQGKIYLKSDNDVTWQGNTYEGIAIKLDGVSKSSSEETSRPKLSIWNPSGVFSYLVDKGSLDNATIYRIRVLRQHLEEDMPIFRKQQWRVSRISSITRRNIAMELRDQLDGQFFQVPGRMFIPPDFPQVSLS